MTKIDSMFQKAYEIASNYTSPLILAYRFFDKTVDSGLGSFIILNDDGWLMTAAHNLQAAIAFNQHKPELADYYEQVEKINQDTGLNSTQKDTRLKEIKANDKWLTHLLVWVGANGAEILETVIYGEHDMAFLRIDRNFLSPTMKYPKIQNPAKFKIGTSLCKLGYPFYPIRATFNEQHSSFDFPPNLLPIPSFPIEGIYTRNMLEGKSQDGMDIIYLETSSPALKGQSGGPIFDVEGNIYAVVAKNLTLPLGFKGEVEINGQKFEENQFINVGIGVHAQTIVTLLNKHKIKFELAD